MSIFGISAPRYWALGKPAIPLKVGLKAPWIDAWQVFADRMPTEREQRDWLNTKGTGNIGMPCGPAAGIVIIDQDMEDPRVDRVLEALLPPSPWKRIGKKGAAYAYRFEGERTFQIKNSDGNVIVELLSKGRQVAVPPSIHPDTGKPYVANCELLDVIGSLPALPKDVETLLREALKAEGFELSSKGSTKITTWIPAGARDSAMTSHAGLLARAITRGERTLLEALGEIKSWVENYVEQVAGDEISVEKAQIKIVDFLMRDVTGEKRKALPKGWDDGLTAGDKQKMGLTFSEDDEKWDLEKLTDYLMQEFERHVSPDTAGWTRTVQMALDRMARNDTLGAIPEEKVLKFIVSQSKGSYSLATLRKELVKLRAGELKGTNHSEVAKAVVKDLEQFGQLKFHQGRFWQWKGAAWETMDENDIVKHIADDYGALPVCRKFSDHMQVAKAIASQVKGELKMVSLNGVNFANGFLTEDQELRPHSPDYGCTYVLPYRYGTNDVCPIFLQMLDDSWGEDPDYGDKIMALQEALAVTLMGIAPRYQRAFCLIGRAHSGKSRILEILRGLMPAGSYSSIPPTDWGDKFLPAQMADKLVNFAGEISEKKEIAGEIFKQVVEGTVITAQHKNQAPFEFAAKAAQWFASNHAPKTKDTSEGFNRRWLFLEFPRRITHDQMVIDIDQIVLAAEREQIVAWALQALGRLKANRGYSLPSSHLAMVDDMANQNNSVRYFLSQNPRLRVGKSEHEGSSRTRIMGDPLYDEYFSFCAMAGGVSRVPRTKFHISMKDLADFFGFEQRRETQNAGAGYEYNFITIVGMKS